MMTSGCSSFNCQYNPRTRRASYRRESADELLALLTSAMGMIYREACSLWLAAGKARNAPEQLFSAGTLRKRSSRYRLKPH